MHFPALRVFKEEEVISSRVVKIGMNDLSPGDVVIRAEYSSVNYKDALAITGKGKIMSRFPLVAGVDVAGVVTESGDDRFRAGDEVLVTGYELGAGHDGGFAAFVRAPADWVVPIPKGLNTHSAMQLGTAGFAAGLCLHRMESNGQTPEHGPILVTGATGGVASIAIRLFSRNGYKVIALTAKTDRHAYLKSLGAHEIISRHDLKMGTHPLEKAQWGGALDSVGGDTLAWLTRTVKPWGNIASVGLAGGLTLNTTVMPFILRGIGLLGINSAGCPMPLRREIWQRLAEQADEQLFGLIETHMLTLEELVSYANTMLNGQIVGRAVVKL